MFTVSTLRILCKDYNFEMGKSVYSVTLACVAITKVIGNKIVNDLRTWFSILCNLEAEITEVDFYIDSRNGSCQANLFFSDVPLLQGSTFDLVGGASPEMVSLATSGGFSRPTTTVQVSNPRHHLQATPRHPPSSSPSRAAVFSSLRLQEWRVPPFKNLEKRQKSLSFFVTYKSLIVGSPLLRSLNLRQESLKEEDY
ncbi:hypothetical protein F8388_018916 [Cannabis sativa]|uniref:Uncharacterized protein n=1 Tax=Cannabis sativa TaxID=3483 RepID=A0A7J6G079_CANSA|nr:hypothetical protein F8388_018916 [Cannabis sativa]